jgi:hypothetical protein
MYAIRASAGSVSTSTGTPWWHSRTSAPTSTPTNAARQAAASSSIDFNGSIFYRFTSGNFPADALAFLFASARALVHHGTKIGRYIFFPHRTQ